jgi:ABC-type Fe3+-hydroxamate transport system substrate-binding protein
MSLVLMTAAFAIFIVTYKQAGGDVTAGRAVTVVLPPGVIALIGWANRLLVVAYCVWVVTAARQAIKLRGQQSWPAVTEEPQPP